LGIGIGHQSTFDSLQTMSYKKGSISAHLGQSEKGGKGGGGGGGGAGGGGSSSSSSLSSIFSDSALSKFARTIKPEEFLKKRQVDEEREEDEVDPDVLEARAAKRLVKKQKRKDSLEAAEQAALNKASAANAVEVAKESHKRAEPGTWLAASSKSSSATSTAANVAEGGEGGELQHDSDSVKKQLERRTLFMGNVPISETEKSISKFCSEFGQVESVRLRSVPISGTKVDDAGNQTLVRKVCAQKKLHGDQKGSCNAYVIFANEESVKLALAANNRIIGTRHIRMDTSTPTNYDYRTTVFLGGLPHYADEEEVRAYFAEALPNGQEDIVALRLVRDPETMIGKGIGYLLLNDRDAVMKALSLDGEKFKKRWALRVQTCGKRTKRTAPKEPSSAPASSSSVSLKTSSSSSGGGDGGGGGGGGAGAGGAGGDANKSIGHKRKFDSRSPNSSTSHGGGSGRDKKKSRRDSIKVDGKGHTMDFGAAKRINLKNTNTRTKALKEKGQIKKVKGKKGKRLGGNVKKAMKAAAKASKN